MAAMIIQTIKTIKNIASVNCPFFIIIPAWGIIARR